MTTVVVGASVVVVVLFHGSHLGSLAQRSSSQYHGLSPEPLFATAVPARLATTIEIVKAARTRITDPTLRGR